MLQYKRIQEQMKPQSLFFDRITPENDFWKIENVDYDYVQCNSFFLPPQSVSSASKTSVCQKIYKAFVFVAHLSSFSFLVCVFVPALCVSIVISDADCWHWWKILPSGKDCGLMLAGSNDRHIWNNKDRNQEERRWVMTPRKGDCISWQSELVSHQSDWIFACRASAASAHIRYTQI